MQHFKKHMYVGIFVNMLSLQVLEVLGERPRAFYRYRDKITDQVPEKHVSDPLFWFFTSKKTQKIYCMTWAEKILGLLDVNFWTFRSKIVFIFIKAVFLQDTFKSFSAL